MSDHSLTIERLHAIYHIPIDYPELERARGKLDRILSHDLVAACVHALEGQSLQAQASICLIRKLHFDITLDISAFDDLQLAQSWGSALVGEINAALSRGSDDVIFFQDAVDYLAQFLVDLASGVAWGKWYYDAFAGLRVLPGGVAAREALTRDLKQGAMALRLLAAQGRLERVLSILTEADAQRVFAAFLRAEEMLTTTRADLEVVLAIWHTVYFQNSPHDALRLIAALPATISGVAAVQLLWQFAQALRDSPNPARLIEVIVRRDLAQLMVLVTPPMVFNLPLLIELIDGDEAWLSQITRTVMTGALLSDDMQAKPTVMVTDHGGAFLLLLAMCDNGLEEVLETLSAEDSALLRLLTLAKCLGDSNVLYDPVMCFVTGVERAPSESDWPHISDLSGDLLQRLLIEKLTWIGKVSGRCFRAERIEFSGQDFLLLRDIEQDFWLYAASPDRDGLMVALDSVQASSRQAAECLLLAEDMIEGADVSTPLVLTGASPDITFLPANLRDTYTRFAARSRQASIDLDYFARTAPLLNTQLDLTLTLFARAVLRLLAARLNGFEWSSAAYLSERFLDGSSVIELAEDTIDVRLPDSPLAIILSMAGVNGAAFTLPWLPEFELRLRLQ